MKNLMQLENKYNKEVKTTKVISDLHFEKLESDLEKALNLRDTLNQSFLRKEELTLVKLSMESYLGDTLTFRSENHKDELSQLKLRNENFITDAIGKLIDWLKSFFGGGGKKDVDEKAAAAGKAAAEKISSLDECDFSRLNKIFNGGNEEDLLIAVNNSKERMFNVIKILPNLVKFSDNILKSLKEKTLSSNSLDLLLEEVYKPFEIKASELNVSLAEDGDDADFYCLNFATLYLKDGLNHILTKVTEDGKLKRVKFKSFDFSTQTKRFEKLKFEPQKGFDLNKVLNEIANKFEDEIGNFNKYFKDKEIIKALEILKRDDTENAREILKLKNVFEHQENFITYLINCCNNIRYCASYIKTLIENYNEEVVLENNRPDGA